MADFAVRIIQIPDDDGVLWTNDDTGRFQAQLSAMRTVVALGSRMGFWIDVNGVVGAGLQTGFAADADSRVKFHDTIRPLIHSRHGANSHTRRIGAVIAASHLKVAPHIGKGALFYILDPGTVNTQGNPVLRFAGRATGVATNALAVVYQEAIVHALSSDE
jgi:hypothetical protein